VEVRPALARDLAGLARLGSDLARAHHRWDPERFFLREPLEPGYAWWLAKERRNPRAVVLAATARGRVVGYAYGRIEPREWNTLRERCGVGVDLAVAPRWRGRGLGRALAEELCRRLAALGAPRVVIHVASRNREALRVFRRLGFRPTVVEMAREVDDPPRRAGGTPGPGASGSARRGRESARRERAAPLPRAM
jgi:ribosomal protein S18 acetylase RimI-like enzyme